mgnify:FL=1|jgi:hypothetical protein
MSLADALRQETAPNKEKCAVALVRAQLNETDLATLNAALANPTVSAAAIARALTDIGFPTKQHTMTRHRRNDCSCDAV